MDIQRFTSLTGTRQLDVIADRGVFLAEEDIDTGHSLYFLVDGLYVSLCFPADVPRNVRITPFNNTHAMFDHLVDLLPVRVDDLMDTCT